MVYVLCMSGATTGLQKLFAGTTLQERKEAPDGSRNHQRFWLGCVHPLGDFDFNVILMISLSQLLKLSVFSSGETKFLTT